MNIIPRICQEWATKASLKGLRGSLKRALVVLATGLGKTLAAAFIAKKFCAKHTLFLVHNNFILKHAMDEFGLVFDEKTKMAIYNGMSKKGVKDAHIVFATWQTMGANLKQWDRNHFGLIIVDEAQHTEADTYRPTVDHFIGSKLGITATPDRTDNTDIRDVFGQEVINITLEEAIARGWLPRIEYHVVTDESLDDDALQKIAAEIRKSKRRFTMAEVNRRIFIKKRDVEIARIINDYDEKAIVFCNSIRHAERMRKPLKLAATFHSEKGVSQKDTWNKNQVTLDALKNGIVRRVCAVNAFNEGVNVPSIGLVAFCRVTNVLTIFRQQLGRGLRPGKDKLIVLDFVGNLERIQLVLATMNRISDLHEKYTPKEGIEREGYERQRFEVSGKGFEFTFSDKVVDLMEVLEHCEREIYPTLLEATLATRELGIDSKRNYGVRHREDLRLPSNPSKYYQDFPGWGMFLGTGMRSFRPRKHDDIYPLCSEASQAAQELKINDKWSYPTRYKEDPSLPSDPRHFYKDFPGWGKFLGFGILRSHGRWVYRGHRNSNRPRYKTCAEASCAVQRLKPKPESRVDYEARYKEDSCLLCEPQKFYKDWPGWPRFLGKV